MKKLVRCLIFSNPFTSSMYYWLNRKFISGKRLKKYFTSRGDPEAQFLLGYDFNDKVVYDIGSSTGQFTQFFTASVGRKGYVVAFEPNPTSYQYLKNRIGKDIDSNVLVLNIGVGLSLGTCQMYVRNTDPGTGSMNSDIRHQIIEEDDYHVIEVPICFLDNYILSEQKGVVPDFIKVDTEGMEFDILKGATGVLQKYHPDLFIEIHGATPALKEENIRKIVKFLIEHQSYSIYHVESGKEINLENYPIASEGHIYCTSIS